MNTRKSILFAVALLSLAACQAEMQDIALEEPIVEEVVTEQVPAGIIPPSITAVQEQGKATKSVLEVDSEGVGTIYWTPSDEINVFYGTTGTHYVSQNTANATTAVFKTTDVIGTSEGASENIWGLYPYNSSATCTGSAVNTTLPATQYGVPGTFDEDLFITLAHNTSTALEFFNVCGGIKFSLSRNDITSITFRGNNNEDIAGDISLNFVDGLPNVSVTSGVKTITLTPKTGTTFASGEYYYLVLRPVTLESGFTMMFETTGGQNGVFEYTTSAVTIKRSKFGKKDEIDSYAAFSIPIWYTSTDGEIVTPYNSDAFGVLLMDNTYANGVGRIVFDGDVMSIGLDAFRNCTNLATIVIPNCVNSIGTRAFSGCSNLSSLVIPDGVVSIAGAAFYGCSALASITIPDSVVEIAGNSTFNNCSNLESSIVLPEGTTEVGDNMFYNCQKLQSVIIPESVKKIRRSAFERCNSLSEIIIPNSVTTIDKYAFRNSGIESISLPEGLKTIELETFAYCSSLATVLLPSTIKTIGSYAFSECSSLTSINIPQGVSEIGSSAFYYCRSLTSLTLPNTVTTIGESAFRVCTSMESITIYASTPPTAGQYLFYSNGCKIYVPSASLSKYKNAQNWSTFSDRIYSIQ